MVVIDARRAGDVVPCVPRVNISDARRDAILGRRSMGCRSLSQNMGFQTDTDVVMAGCDCAQTGQI